ncbi:hypothetical protein [Clostridium hydrogenum]|uniref:hypothetical protein n=1 Tax=Clostridium hydrogenum TaxID=2855764 RepID=UPI001F3B31E7|nr:hypothetical protein [Clostridium hydrogenum]
MAEEDIIFEHGPFDYEQENLSVKEKIEKEMATFDFADSCLRERTHTRGLGVIPLRFLNLYY